MRSDVMLGTLCLLVGCTPLEEPTCTPPTGLPAFPGAQGFGSTTPGGRGGAVIEVTSLADSGPGTLRAALSASGPRIVVFRVGGNILLESQLDVREPYLTVAGQTAPGGGIQLTGSGLVVFTHDVVLQHLRIRPGDIAPVDPATNDALQILGVEGGGDAHDIIVDHCSLAWSEDEVFNALWGAHDFTISYTIMAEGLDRSRHVKGSHSAGYLLSRTTCTTTHHVLLAHNRFRNPLIIQGGLHEYLNNVAYDWGDLAGEVSPLVDPTHVNFIGNSWLAGPESDHVPSVEVSGGHAVSHFVKAYSLAYESATKLYMKDNTGTWDRSGSADEYANASVGFSPTRFPDENRSASPFGGANVQVEAVDAATATVLAQTGATKPARDLVDARIVNDVVNHTGKIINSPSEVGGFQTLAGGVAPADSDHDGMSDAWEQAQGLAPNDPSDGVKDADGDGYTNVEEYLHSLQ